MAHMSGDLPPGVETFHQGCRTKEDQDPSDCEKLRVLCYQTRGDFQIGARRAMDVRGRVPKSEPPSFPFSNLANELCEQDSIERKITRSQQACMTSLHAVGDGDASDLLSQGLTEITYLFPLRTSHG
eukprot:XP_028337420.1 uncharacterized protein LOC102975633 isoform X1 [Physeter catodon]